MVDLTRRTALLGAVSVMTSAAAPAPAATNAWSFTFPSIEDGVLNFADYRGRVLLVANTASFCGYTYQYEQLEKLHASLGAKGLTVIGVPSQDFNQESADNSTVKQFCDATFGVEFPMAGLTHVRGPQAHPFYKWVKATKNWQPDWNFHKVLITREGAIGGLFSSTDEPGSGRLRHAIDTAIAATA
jgi:glutathione peroxidase